MYVTVARGERVVADLTGRAGRHLAADAINTESRTTLAAGGAWPPDRHRRWRQGWRGCPGDRRCAGGGGCRRRQVCALSEGSSHVTGLTLGAVRHLVAAYPVGTKTGGTLARVRTSVAEQEQRCTLTLKAGDVAGLAAEAKVRTADLVDAVCGCALLVLRTWAACRSGRGAIAGVTVFASGAGRSAAAEPVYTIPRLTLLCGITRNTVLPGRRARPEVPRYVTELARWA